MNKLSAIAVLAIVFGFFTEFISYLCGVKCVTANNGIEVLWWCWSVIALVGGLASIVFGGMLFYSTVLKEAMKDVL